MQAEIICNFDERKTKTLYATTPQRINLPAMEEHDDASLMLGEEEGDHHHPHHHHHHHEEDNDHGMHEEDMDIEPTRIVGVSSSSPGRLERDEFWDHEPTKEEIWEVCWIAWRIVFVEIRFVSQVRCFCW
mmetsp:Transcript_75781/g.153749  ORF Transcript_75781/g.153749 Transcript_75781/m.153749 type:complete len:130 (-) Transcript_75781:126-515(-)